ncbi:hypothetical protein GCM10020358_44140 [Amorphoplanes nipponensis]|uniref:Mycothiol maleylpyruvate isomerase N-terminal domain-containing protein n=1 Tax=Actinoplanes nipponensis TaxID=135950 RepID=A0A919JFI9_9ACTN|nr:hypothetical protein [Actinoplanes nipponensis]GIE48833.1 hypothetical protein Ani05nite_23670 [Actinoplanes nipponensis]
MPSDPVTAADVRQAVRLAADTLTAAVTRDWRVPAGDLDWDCWETVEHIADDLFAYAGQLGPRRPSVEGPVPFGWDYRRPGGPALTIYAVPADGRAGLIQVLESCGALLAAMVEVTPADVRAHHVYGASDPEGFAAMGVVETLVHMRDVAAGLELPWEPPEELCVRVLHRLFPGAPATGDRWPALLWATGRIALPDRARLTSWRWHGEPR